MGSWGPKVERWREIVLNELSRQKMPLPTDLGLAVIHVESRGYPGSTNEKSGASGLMQVMPKTLQWYNTQTGDTVTLAQMRSKGHPVEQIRVGLWVLGQFWRGAYRYLRDRVSEIPADELARIADLFYVAGPGATKKRLDKLEIPFFSYVEARFPEWNALPHPRNVFKVLPESVNWRPDDISSWLEGSVKAIRKEKRSVSLVLAALIAGYWYLMRRQK